MRGDPGNQGIKEAGANIGISRNALTPLKLKRIGPSAAQSIERAGAFAQDAFVVKLAVGRNQGFASHWLK